MAAIGDLVVRIVGDNAELDAAIDKSKKKTQEFLAEMSKVGKQMSMFVTAPIVAGLGLAIKSFADAEAATKRLSGAIQLAGTFTSGATNRLSDFATALMRTTGVSDELIRNLMAQAVAMGRTEEEAKKLASAAVDIAARGIMPLDAAFEALQVTYEGIAPRSKELRAITGDLTEAQLKAGVAVDKVGDAVKGAGVEMRGTTEGSMKNFANSMDELGESFGAVIAPEFNKLINTIAKLADGFAAMDDSTKKAIIAGAGVLGVAGPLLVIIPGIVKAIQMMNTAFATSAGPLGLAIVAVSLLVAGLVKVIAVSRRLADEQKLVDDAMKGSLNSTQEYDEALKVLADRQVYAGDSLVAMVKKQGMTLRGIFVEGKLFFETVDKSGKVIKRISDDEKIRIDNELSQLKAQRDAILLNRKVIEDKEKVQSDAIQKRIAAEAAAAAEAAIAAAEAEAARQEKVDGIKAVKEALETAGLTEEQIIEKETARLREWGFADAEIMLYMKATHKDFYADELENIGELTEGERDLAAMRERDAAQNIADSEIEYEMSQRQLEIEEETHKKSEKLLDDAVAKEKQRKEKQVDDWIGYGQSVINIMSDVFSAINAQNDRELKAEKDKLDKLHALDEKALDEKIKAENDAIDKVTKDKLDAIDKELQAKLYAAGLAEASTEEQYRAEIAAALEAGDIERAEELQKALDTLLIKQDFEAQKKAIEDAATAAKVVKDAADQKDREALDLAAEKKKLRLEYNAALARWNFELASAIANAALAVVKCFAELGPIAGTIAAALIGVATGVEIAALAGAKPVMPALAEGGIIPARAGGTVFRGGEGGQSEAVIPLDQLDRMLSQAGGGGGSGDVGDIHLVVRLDSRALLDTIFPATRNGTVLIDGRAIVR